MNLKKLFLILSSLIIIIGLFITLLSKDYTANSEYSKFFTDIESKIDSVKKIEIETTENAVYLFNNNGKWEIPGYENYPASGEKIKKFLISIVQLKGVDKKTKNPAAEPASKKATVSKKTTATKPKPVSRAKSTKSTAEKKKLKKGKDGEMKVREIISKNSNKIASEHLSDSIKV